MKTKMYVLLIICLFVLSSSAAFADEADNVEGFEIQIDDLTKSEIEIMDDPNGAIIRLLQLEKDVTCNIYKGEYLVSFLFNLDIETIEFEAILAEMQLLLEEIQTVNPESSEVDYLFAELKQDAIGLTTEFRDAIHNITDETTREIIKESMQKLECKKDDELDEQIDDQIVLFNKRKLETILNLLGITDSGLTQGYKNKTLSLQQVKLQLENKVQIISEDEQIKIYFKIKEDQISTRIMAKTSIDNLTSQYQLRACIRLRNRINSSETVGNETIRQYLQQRMRLRLNQYGDNGSGGSGQGSGNGSGGSGQGGPGEGGSGGGSGSGQGSGNGGSGGSGQGSGEGGSGGGSGGGGSGEGDGGNGNHNGQGGGGGP